MIAPYLRRLVALDTRSAEAWRAGFKMTGERMSTDNPSSVSIQVEALPIASVPAWFGEVALLAHTLPRLGLLAEISDLVRFPLNRFGPFEVVPFASWLIGHPL